jgi:hypothetical protein
MVQILLNTVSILVCNYIIHHGHVCVHAGTREQLVGAATGGGGGRGAKGRKRGPGKSELRKFKPVRLGEGMLCLAHLQECKGMSHL